MSHQRLFFLVVKFYCIFMIHSMHECNLVFVVGWLYLKFEIVCGSEYFIYILYTIKILWHCYLWLWINIILHLHYICVYYDEAGWLCCSCWKWIKLGCFFLFLLPVVGIFSCNSFFHISSREIDTLIWWAVVIEVGLIVVVVIWDFETHLFNF